MARSEPSNGPKYDVAISFLADNLPLALRLEERLSEQWNVFVFSERQREIAGTDGVETFSEIFRKEALLDLVLYREGWGDDGWTRIEAGAIKERQLETGFEALFIIKLDNSDLPSWMPTRFMYFDVQEYSVEEMVGAIHLRLRDLGGDPSPETAADRAKRLQREAERKEEQRRILHSKRGADLASAAIEEMLSITQEEAEEIAEAGIEIAVIERDADPTAWAVNVPRGGLTFGWARQYRNSLESSQLVIQELDGPAHFRGWAGRKPNKLNVDYAEPVLDANNDLAWKIDHGPDRALSTAEVVDRYLSRLIDRQFGKGGPGAGQFTDSKR